jgi:hypothetical protein
MTESPPLRKLGDAAPFRQLSDERAWLARDLTLPLHYAIEVDNADRSFGE